MAIDRPLLLTTLVAIGAALLVFPFLPGDWPSPLADGVELTEGDLLQMKIAGARVDQACAKGDVADFAVAITQQHHDRLSRQLEALDCVLDSATLKQFVTKREYSFAEILRMPVLAGEVRGRRAAVAVGRPAGDGGWLLEFEWDGRRLRLDDSTHATAAVLDGSARARALVAEAVASRR